MAEQPKLKAYVSKFTVRVGPVSMVGRLISTMKPGQKSEKSPDKFVMVTPGDNAQVVQRYIDPAKPKKLWEPGDLDRAKVLPDGSLVPVDKEQIAEVKKSELPKDVLNLTVHDTDEVENAVFPDAATAYVFEPDFSDPVNVQWHSLLLAVLSEHPEFTYMGVCNLRNNEGLFRLTVWRERLVVQRMVYPEALEDHKPLADAHLTTVDKPAMNKAVKMMTKLTQPFDADEYVNETRQRLVALGEALAGDGPVVVATEKVKKDAGFDLMAALDAFDD